MPSVSSSLGKAARKATRIDLEWEEEIIALTEPERHRIEDTIRDTPAADIRDLAIKLMVRSGDGAWGVPNALILECARRTGRDFATLPRCVIQDDN